nr:DUF4097 family beta strand repeat-containing protein [Staphylococcus croceilyticus]
MYITIPEKGLNKLNIDANMGELSLDNLKVNEGSIHKDGEDVYINQSELKNINIQGDSTDIFIKNSVANNVKSKTQLGNIKVSNSKVKDSIFICDSGSLRFIDMNSESDLKGSSKRQSIIMSYKNKPKDTLLKLHPGTREAKVKNKAFHDGKVGKSKNIVEFYTVKKDIVIK